MNRNEQIERARQLMFSLQFDRAVAIYNQLLASDPQDAEVHYFKAQAFANAGNLAAAVEEYDRTLEVVRDPGNRADVLISKGNALLEQERLDAADACFDQALAVKPRLSTLFVEKARIAFCRGRFADSVQCCDRALALNSSDARAWNNKAHALIKLERYDEAIDCERKALKIEPNYAAAWTGLHLAYKAKGDLARAQEALERSLGQGPGMFVTQGHQAVPVPPPQPQKHWWQIWR